MKKFKRKLLIFSKNIKKYIKRNPKNSIIIGSILVIFIILSIITNILVALAIMILLAIIGLLVYKLFFKKENIKTKDDIQIFDKIEDKKGEMKSMKKKNKKVTKKRTFRRLLLMGFLGFICLCLSLFTIFMLFIIITAPKFDEKNLYHQESSILYDVDGKEFAKLGTEQREIIDYDQLPEVLIDAIIATEDSRFYQHNGFDLPRFLKASAGQVLRHNSGGASTLTMQVVKNHFTSTTSSGIKGIIRKFTDIYMAVFKVEKKYTKKEIIEFYVNSNYLGDSAYGVEQACINYFGKSAKDINLSEAALIAGLFQAPGTYDPTINPELAKERRSTVLYLMEKHGYITKEQRDIADSIEVSDLLTEKTEASSNPYQGFIDTVVADIEETTGENPYSTAMKVYTTMDRDKQDYLNDIISGKTFSWENDLVDTGISIIDVETGEMAAVGTGRNNSGERSFNNATMANRQIGSTAKPLYDYGPAIEYEDWSTYNLLVDEPYKYSDGNEINNWDGNYFGLMTAREALRKSRNIPALKAFQAVENDKIKEFVTGLGLHPELDSNGIVHQAHAIGGYNGESPVDVSAAYAAFANGGYYVKPHSFSKIVYRENDEEYKYKKVKKKVMGEDTAYMVADMLVSTPSYALGAYANVNNVTYGAKTGTSNFSDETMQKFNLPYGAVNDLWVAGINTKYSITVWYGYEKINNQYVSRMGTGEHMRLFQAVAKGVFTTNEKFKKPNSVVQAKVEMGSWPASLPSAYTPDSLIVTELFKKGTEPTTSSGQYSQAPNPTDFKASVDGEKINLSWKAGGNANGTGDISSIFHNSSYYNSYLGQYGAVGGIVYNIYLKTGGGLSLITTTSSTSYAYRPSESGTYNFVVKAMYSRSAKSESNGTSASAKVTISPKEITITKNGSDPIRVNIGDSVDPGVSVICDGKDVTSEAEIIYNDIDTSTPGTYTLNISASYNGAEATISRKVEVK